MELLRLRPKAILTEFSRVLLSLILSLGNKTYKKKVMELGEVAFTCNPSSLRG